MTSPEQAAATLERGHLEIQEQLDRLGPADLEVGGIGGGEWSPKDLLGHLALWHEIALRTIDEARAGSAPWIVGVFAGPGPGPNDDELVARAPWPVDRAREAYEAARAASIEAIRAIEEAAWSSPVEGWTEPPATLGGLLGVVLGRQGQPFGHAFAHLDELRDFADARSG
jgi:hypothetical protein